MIEQPIGIEIVRALQDIREELKLLREDYQAAKKINDFNLKQLEAITSGGIVGVNAMPAGPPERGPRRM